jgi:threonine dehydratase
VNAHSVNEPQIVPLTLPDIEDTRALLAPHLIRTPVHRWEGREIAERLGEDTEVLLKLELFQHTGTFKPRGALSVMLRQEPATIARGVTAVSAGNHATATAYAAKVLGTSAKVVMFASANPARTQRCRAYGAEIVVAPDPKSGFDLVRQIEQEEGRLFVHPFEGPLTALGTATIGLEWFEQAGALDLVIIPIGGGGLCAGIASAIKLVAPKCEIIGVEPVGADTMYRSFAAGEPVSRSDLNTIADSLASPYALPYSFTLCRANVDELVLVDDDQIRDAMGILFREMKLAVEPAGAAATAALLGPLRARARGKRVGIIACGANIDIQSFARHVSRAAEVSGLI